jgi:hypothetical protein
MNQALRVLLIGDSDSQLHYCMALCNVSEDAAVETTINVVPKQGTAETLLGQLKSHSIVWEFPLEQLLRQSTLESFHAIGVFMTGSKIAAFRREYHKLCKQNQAKPAILFCGFNGVVLEKFEEGVSWRLGYDLICLNGPRDQQRLERFLRYTPFASQQTTLTGLSRRKLHKDSNDSREQRDKQLLFAEQVVMPSRPAERSHMVCVLADLARRSPDWRVVIKPRIRENEQTFYRGLEHITKTVEKSIAIPPKNLKISYEPIADLLKTSRLMGTISSTAVFDALDLGCQPVIMADFGLSSKNGTHFFKDSGLLRNIERCKDLNYLESDIAPPNLHWLAWVGYWEDYKPLNLYTRIRELLNDRPSPPDFGLPGYEVAHVISDGLGIWGVNSNILRSQAEEAIQKQRWEEAEELLLDALQQKPDNRNIARRLKAIRTKNKLIRSIRLRLTPGFKLKT